MDRGQVDVKCSFCMQNESAFSEGLLWVVPMPFLHANESTFLEGSLCVAPAFLKRSFLSAALAAGTSSSLTGKKVVLAENTEAGHHCEEPWKNKNKIVDLFQRLHMTEQRYCANPRTVTLTKCTQVALTVRPPFCSGFTLQGETSLGLIIPSLGLISNFVRMPMVGPQTGGYRRKLTHQKLFIFPHDGDGLKQELAKPLCGYASLGKRWQQAIKESVMQGICCQKQGLVLLFPSFGGMLICFGFLPVMILLNSLKVVPVTCTVAHGKVCKYCCRYCRKEKHFYNHS